MVVLLPNPKLGAVEVVGAALAPNPKPGVVDVAGAAELALLPNENPLAAGAVLVDPKDPPVLVPKPPPKGDAVDVAGFDPKVNAITTPEWRVNQTLRQKYSRTCPPFFRDIGLRFAGQYFEQWSACPQFFAYVINQE